MEMSLGSISTRIPAGLKALASSVKNKVQTLAHYLGRSVRRMLNTDYLYSIRNGQSEETFFRHPG